MTAPLTDFEPDQIDLLLEIIEINLNTVQMVRMKAELKEDTQEMGDIIKKCDKDLDTLTLFKVQLMNAKADLKQIETTHQ